MFYFVVRYVKKGGFVMCSFTFRGFWQQKDKGILLFNRFFVIFVANKFIIVLLSRNKSTKNSPLKRRDGSVEILSIANLLALTTAGVKAQILHSLSLFSQPPPTSLLRRGGLPLTFGEVKICSNEFASLRLCDANGIPVEK